MAITNATTLADYAAGISTQNATLKVDSGNKRVGIGTTNPKQTLQVGTAVSVYGNSGIVSATSFYGDGANLTNVGMDTGVVVSDQILVLGVTTVGSAVTINSTGIDAVSGVITASSFVGNVTGNASGTAGGLTGTPDITVRNITGVAATFTGVLTYEDVTNVDSVGIVTARGGLEVGAAGVGGTITALGHAEFAGVVTATQFRGGSAKFTDDGADSPIVSILADNATPKAFVIGNSTYNASESFGQNFYTNNAGEGYFLHVANGSYKDYHFSLNDGSTNKLCVQFEADDQSVQLYAGGSKKLETHNTGIRVTGIATVTSNIYINTNGSSIAENNLNFRSAGKAYIDHGTTGQDIDFRMSHGSALDRTAITIGSAGVSTFYDTPHDDLGYMRNVPLNTQASTYTLVAADSGKTILASDTITIADGVFEAGDVVTIINNTGGNITINKGSVLYWTADGTSANRTLATRGMASIYFTHNTTGYIGGAGLS